MAEKATLAKEYIRDLECAREQEFQEQQKMQAVLQQRRAGLGMEEMTTERCVQQQHSPAGVNSEQSQVRVQERMLSQWKESFRRKENDIAAIPQRQNEISDKWHQGES